MAMPGADTVFDLTILYMSDVINWCEYLFDIFNPFDVYLQSEEITEFPTHENTIQNICNSRVQVLIISPKFIETATGQISEITGRNSVVGLLCGVEESELVRLKDRIPGYVHWRLVDARDGPRCITGTTLDVVDEMIKQAEMAEYHSQGGNPDSDLYLPMGPAGGTNDSVYTPMGGKKGHYVHMGGGGAVTEDHYLEMGGQLVYEEMHEHGQDESHYLDMDEVKEQSESFYLDMNVNTTKPEELYDTPKEVKEQSEPFYLDMNGDNCFPDDTYEIQGTLPARGSQCLVAPDRVRTGVREKVLVIFPNSNVVQDNEGSYKVHLSFGSKSSDVLARYINPYTLRFESPKDLPGGTYKCTLSHNGSRKATFKLIIQSDSDILGDILNKTLHPLNFICESLGISPADSNQLDNVLHERCKRHMPPSGFRSILPVQPTGGKQLTRYPTALHFAAKFGLRTISALLCQWPGADQALRLKNCDGQTPDQMAADDDLKTFLIGSKDRSVGLHDSPNPEGYVTMSNKVASKMGPHGHFDSDFVNQQKNYDRPFRVPIPVKQVSNDEDIQRLVTGDADDIYNYYDSWQSSESTSMVRDNDEDDDDDDSQKPPPPTKDYETLDSDQPSAQVHDVPPTIPVSSKPALPSPDPPAISRRPDQPPSTDVRKAKSGSPKEQEDKLRSLIDLQNQVKEGQLTIDKAIILFKEWEQTHGKSPRQTPSTGGPRNLPKIFRKLNTRASQQGGRRLRARSEPVATTGFTSLTTKPHKELALRSVSANTYGIPQHADRGQRLNVPDKSDRGPTSPSLSRSHPQNGSSDNSNGPTATDASKGENGSDAPVEPPPPRSPCPSPMRNQRRKRDSINRDLDFSPEYIRRPIPPIPPRQTSGSTPGSSSDYQRLPPGVPRSAVHTRLPDPTQAIARRQVIGSGAGDTEKMNEHTEHPTSPTPDDLPPRNAPPPPRRSSQENSARGADTLRRQSDPSVTSKEGEPQSPSNITKRPVPRPRARPKPSD
ncbi:uncharacterized protein [Diadema setosum]|uniref:uncharacterized protein n=1 Tax=Diadema setosum TaxID=31175 RepID=UPI003B3AF01A